MFKFKILNKFKKNHSEEPYKYMVLKIKNNIKIVLKKLTQYWKKIKFK